MENATNASADSSRYSGQLGEAPSVWYLVVCSCISVITIGGNGAVIVVILTKSRLRVSSNWFIVSLAVADLCVGLFITPIHIACVWLPCDWDIKGLLEEFLLYCSIFNLCAMTLDRYLAVSFPLKYFAYVSRQRVIIAVWPAWLLPLVNMLLHFTWLYSEPEKKAKWQRIFTIAETFLLIIVPTVLLFLANVRILLLVRKHSARTTLLQQQLEFNMVPVRLSNGSEIANQSSRASSASSVGEMSLKSTNDTLTRNQQMIRSRDRKAAAKVVGTVNSLFIVCWSLSICASMCFYFRVCQLPRAVHQASWVLMLTNSAVNPLVYAFFRADLRRELLSCPCSWKTAPNSQNRQIP